MTRTLLIAAWAIVLSASSPVRADTEVEDPVSSAWSHIEAGELREGLAILGRERLRRSLPPGKRAAVLRALARFYEQYIGDPAKARRFNRQVLKLDLPEDEPSSAAARAALARLDAQADRFRKEDRLLEQVRVRTRDPEQRQRRVEALEELVGSRADYPQLASAWYYLGKHHLELENHYRAYRAFQKALELRPALGFHLPAPHRMAYAYELWVRQALSGTAWGLLGLFLLAGAMLFFRSRPWRSLGLRHCLLLAGLVAAWGLLFEVFVRIAGQGAAMPPGFPEPVYFVSDPPLAGSFRILFWYGLAGLVGCFIIAVSTRRLRPRWTWTLVSATASLLLFSALMTVFYLEHCNATFHPDQESRCPYLGGTFYFSLIKDQDPYILTDPMAYCGFQENMSEIDEKEIREWFGRYAGLCKERMEGQ